MKKVFIITEGGKNIGFGHITRCISLYQAFEEKGITPNFIVDGDESILDLISDKNHRIFNWIKEKEYLFNYIKNADIVIIDSYLAKRDIYNRISKLVKVPVYIDDSKRLNYPKGIVVNGSIYSEELDYPKNNEITYLLGTKYTLLRKEFWKVPKKEIKEEIESVMVTFGGDDMRNMTPKVINLIKKSYPDFKVNVVIGNGFDKENISKIEAYKIDNIFLHYNLNANEMKKIMIDTDVVISAGGQTSYELARLGVASIVISVAENQINSVVALKERGLIEYAGWWEYKYILENILKCLSALRDKKTRTSISNLGQNLITGLGARKIVGHCLKDYFNIF